MIFFFYHQRKNYSLKENKESTNKNEKINILHLIISFDVDNIILLFFLKFYLKKFNHIFTRKLLLLLNNLEFV